MSKLRWYGNSMREGRGWVRASEREWKRERERGIKTKNEGKEDWLGITDIK